MFYSQFILAKKGPLGTIWIAAHLERKLRKNQVADTDIGVSVDSILFPEVPIALRLSSHLLLGVVRIYSRKVSYLFDDCSEALLKVKQAFRSTAVDLPPEESTAPYHSITLPETFDLDDFELPDNDIFQGNYVDHHVSAREQITLQDTMEGVVYSSSQFGLDERFGDGDASQVGLDLEEDLFLDKVVAPEIDTVVRADPQISDGSFPKGEASQEGGSSEAMPMNGTTNKIEDLIANSVFTDVAQAPSTPGLIEEPNLPTVQGGLAYDDNLDSEDHNLTERGESDIQQDASSKKELNNKNYEINLSLGDQLNHNAMAYTPAEDNGFLSSDEKVNHAELQDLSTVVNTDNVAVNKFDGENKVEPINNDAQCIKESSMLSLDQINAECEQNLVEAGLHETAEKGNDEKKSHPEGKTASNAATSLELPCHPEHINSEAQHTQTLEDCRTLDDLVDERTVSTFSTVLRACNSHMNHHDTPSNDVNDHTVPSGLQTEDVSCTPKTSGMVEELHDCGTSAKVQGDGSHMADCVGTGENQADVGERDDDHMVNQVDKFDKSQVSDMPAFEKLLSAPQILPDKPDDLVVESTPDKEVLDSVDGSVGGTNISGRKRSLTESTLTMETLNSAESFGATRSKRTADFIPDDDDLLSSILVGRKSSALKMKPTPPAPEATSMKRTRSATKPSAMKRKVLIDDSMVLLGEVIREQLTNTEDIRRLRKKAPCTRTEIWMIQRQFLEEEFFSELVLTGISSELAYVHGGTFDLSGIRITEVGDDDGFMKVTKDEGCSTLPMPNQDDQIEQCGEPNVIDGQPADLAVEIGNQQGRNYVLGINHDSVDANPAEIAGNGTSEHQPSGEMFETIKDVGNAKIPGIGNHAVILGHDTSQTDLASGDINEITSSSVVWSDVRDDPTSAENSLHIHNESIENVAFPRDMANGEAPDGVENLDHSAVGPESMGEEFPLMEIKDATQAEIREEIQASDFASAKEDGASLVDVPSEMAGCTSSVNQPVENIGYHDIGVDNVDGSTTVSLRFNENDKITNNFGNEESEIASTHLGLDAETKDGSINDPGQPLCQEADQQSTMNAEITSLDHITDGNFGDFEDAAMVHDTEFLNMDDDEDGEEDEHGMMNAEEAPLLDNSGWSSRTRAVANYLQNLFDKEHGRRVLSVDNLLAGKTRKEASRMFFETLVLKTKDYIQVEQTKPFDDINIKARMKLMKSDF